MSKALEKSRNITCARALSCQPIVGSLEELSLATVFGPDRKLCWTGGSRLFSERYMDSLWWSIRSNVLTTMEGESVNSGLDYWNTGILEYWNDL